MTDRPHPSSDNGDRGDANRSSELTQESTRTSADLPSADSGATAEHKPAQAAPRDATVISKRAADGALAPPPPARPRTNAEIGRSLVGSQLNEFTLEEFVGGGGMGAVFRSTDQSLNRTVAVKVLTTRHAEEAEEAKRFEQEAQSAARLNHENIAQVYDAGEASGWQYIVFEFVQGQNLRDFVQQVGPLPVRDTISIATQIAAALEHASARDVVHRDIKPSNVIIDENSHVKLVDMGLARLNQVEGTDDLTASGMTLGTFDYISPEQGADPKSADARSDLYSLGCTIYYMLTGRPPFPTGTPIQKLLAHKNTLPANIDTIRDDVPAGLSAVVEKLLEKDPLDRFQSPRSLIATLEALSAGREIRIERRQRASERRPGWTRHLEWLIPTAALLLTVFFLESWNQSGAAVSELSTLPRFVEPTRVEPAQSDPNAAPTRLQSTFGAMPGTSDSGAPGALRMPSGAGRRTVPLQTPPMPGPATFLQQQTSSVPESDQVIVVKQEGDVWSQAQAEKAVQLAIERAILDPTIRRIEFAVSGRFAIAPVELQDRDIEWRATNGARPVFLVAASASETSAFQVTRSRLVLDGLSFELIGDASASLVRLEDAESVEIRNGWVTLSNSGSGAPSVLLIEDDSPAWQRYESDEFPSRNQREALRPIPVTLSNCVVRGDAVVLRASSHRSVRLAVDNGLFLTSQCFASIRGTANVASNVDQHQFELDHVTAIAESCFVEMEASAASPMLMTVDLNSTNSIFISSHGAPFVRFSAPNTVVAQFDQRFFFGGKRNDYEAIDSFWSLNGEDGGSFADWQQRWIASETLSRSNRIVWPHRLWESSPVSLLRPFHFLLKSEPRDTSINAEAAPPTAGFRFSQMPRSPLFNIAPLAKVSRARIKPARTRR